MNRMWLIAWSALLLGCTPSAVENAHEPPPASSDVAAADDNAPPANADADERDGWASGNWNHAAILPAPRNTSGLADTDKNHLTALILQDLEFVLLTWKSPGPHPKEMEAWLSGTKTRLENLKTIAAKSRLDPNVIPAIDLVDDILNKYDQLCTNLKIVEWVDDADRTAGDPSAVSIAAQTIGAGLEGASTGLELGNEVGGPKGAAVGAATMGVLGAFGEALGQHGRKLDQASRYSALDKKKADHVQDQIETAKRYFAERVANLRQRVGAIDAGRTVLPSFELHGDIDRYRRQDDRAPFPHVLRAYSLVRSNRKAAASEFATAAAKLSASFDTYSYGYRGPFLMMSGHLMEFEARHGSPASRVQSAQAAVAYYRAALRELTTIENVPYPYLISYARALAMAGQTGPANELADRIYRRASGDRISRAAQTYDLASVHALSGNEAKAFERLSESYRSFPRRDPYAVRDPLLRSLAASEAGREQLKRLSDHPLVGGTWTSTESSFAKYQFYPDGSLWQQRTMTQQLKGRWFTLDGRTLRLHGRGNGVPDVTVAYKVESDRLRIAHDGRDFHFTRTGGNVLTEYQAGVSSSGRQLSNDGTWRWANGNPATSGRFSTSRTLTGPKRMFWYSWEDPLAGRLSELRTER